MKFSWIVGGALALSSGLAVSGGARAGCVLEPIAEYHLTAYGDEALVDATINGHPVRLLVDTGSTTSIVTQSAVKALHLPRERVNSLKLYDAHGADDTDVAIVQDFALGGVVAHLVPFVIGLDDLKSDDFQGLLGENILDQADLELDFADGVMRLFKPHDCKGDQVVYWGKAYAAAPIAPSNSPADLDLYVSLNGHRELASLDSGAYASFVTTKTAAQVGGGVAVPAAGASDPPVTAFAAFSVGDETIKNAKLRVADLFADSTEMTAASMLPQKVGTFPDLLLGADFVRAHHIYIARGQGLIYFSYNGGPIFRVSGSQGASLPVSSAQRPAPPGSTRDLR